MTNRFDQKFLNYNENYNTSQNIWNKIGQSNKIGQDKKSLIFTFPLFLTTITARKNEIFN